MKSNINEVDRYLKTFPLEVQKELQKIRAVIKKEAPFAKETIAYQMPTYKLGGNLVHFAAFKDHIGFFPTPSGIEELEQKTAKHETGKGTLNFPLDKPIPYDLIQEITKLRVKQAVQNSNDELNYFKGFEQSLRLYDLIKPLILGLGDIKIEVGKSQISFGEKKKLAWIWLPQKIVNRNKDSLTVTFLSNHRITNAQITEAVETKKGTWTNHVIVNSNKEINQKLLNWISESYALTHPN